MNAPLRINLVPQYDQLVNKFDTETHALWSFMKPRNRPCFNFELLADIANFEEMLRTNNGRYLHDGVIDQVNYVIFASIVPGIFNLGGDLNTFKAKIESGDSETLKRYAYQCIDNIWNRLQHYGTDITTIALVQGQALGGGFEAALTADILIAEEGSKLGLPEIMFNLFPGMGALSLLARKVGMRDAERLILSGQTYSAEYLHELGVVDILAPEGEGVEAVNRWIRKNSKQRNGYMAVQKSKREIADISHEELMRITDIWVDAAMRLEHRDLRLMGRLVSEQNKYALPS